MQKSKPEELSLKPKKNDDKKEVVHSITVSVFNKKEKPQGNQGNSISLATSHAVDASARHVG